jgi:hypothetical protein
MTSIEAADLSLEALEVRKRRRKLIITVVLISLGIHIVAGIVAGVVIVARYFATPPAEFHATRDIRVAAQEREHKMNMASFDGAAPKPVFNDKLQSSRPAPFALPSLPKIPLDQMVPLDPSSLITDAVPTSFGTGGLGSGTGTGSGSGSGGLGGMGVGLKFLGIQTNAKRIVMMYDISKTVVGAAARAGVPFETIRDETAKFIDGLGVNVRFGMVEYARNFAFFNPELLPATDPNRAAARDWLTQHFGVDGSFPRGVPGTVTGSPGFLVALEAVFKQEPDVIFVISDGDMQYGPDRGATISIDEIGEALKRLQATLPQPAKIYFLGVGAKPAIERDLRRVLGSHGGGGRYSELKK